MHHVYMCGLLFLGCYVLLTYGAMVSNAAKHLCMTQCNALQSQRQIFTPGSFDSLLLPSACCARTLLLVVKGGCSNCCCSCASPI